MEIKVLKAVGSSQETTSTLSLTAGLKLPQAVKNQVKNDVGQFLIESILSSAHAQESPVEGESWDKLSPKYKKKKIADGLPGEANLEYSGELLDSLEFDSVGDDDIAIGWTGDQAGKADGHANLSGDSQLPQRRLIPGVGQSFKADIQDGIEQIIADAITDNMTFDEKDFDSVGTKAELYQALDEYFPDMSKSEIKTAVARTPSLAQMLDDLDLLDLL